MVCQLAPGLDDVGELVLQHVGHEDEVLGGEGVADLRQLRLRQFERACWMEVS